ncbi:MAG: outer membrane protein assembly factor BamA, partial [Comamonas sp.]
EFKSLVKIKPGEPYNADQVSETIKAFTDYYSNFGFAFAKVEAVPEIDRANNRVNIVLQAQPSRRAYIRRISVSGNNKTRDEVIRREFRQFEASWYDGQKIKLSRDRVDRLGFFTQVDIETQEVPGSPDQVDLMINVVEKPTGSIQLGAGFSSAEKVSLSFGIKQENVFGSGNYLGLDVNTSKYNRTMVVSTTNPYFTDTGISRTYDLYYRTTRPYYDDAAYKIITKGASVRFGVPFSEVDTIFFGAGVEGNEIRPGSYMPGVYSEYCGGTATSNTGCSKTGIPLTLGWSRDNRDSALAPNAGRYQRLNLEASFMSDMRYMKANYQIQQYIPLNKKYTIALNGELGWGKGIGGNPYPIFKNFYSGGLGSVRGFEQGSLGRRDSVNTNLALGGTRKLTLNGEFMVPFPGAGNDRTLRLFTFVDVGNVWAEGESMELNSLRASTGIGISWISPLGPLRLAYAQPIRKESGDRIQKLQFQIGTSF